MQIIKREKKKRNLYHISLSRCATQVVGAAGALRVLVTTNRAIILHRSQPKQMNSKELQGICGRMHQDVQITYIHVSLCILKGSFYDSLLQRWHVEPRLQQHPAIVTTTLLNSTGGMAGRSRLASIMWFFAQHTCWIKNISASAFWWRVKTKKLSGTTQRRAAISTLRLPGCEAASGGTGEELARRMWGAWGHGQPASLCQTQGRDCRQWGRAGLQYIYTSPFPLTPALSSQWRAGINSDIGVLSFPLHLLCLKSLPTRRSVIQLLFIFNCGNWRGLVLTGALTASDFKFFFFLY